jgi:hypothetical protein
MTLLNLSYLLMFKTPRWKSSNDNWGLSAADFQQMHHLELSRYILQWYESRKTSPLWKLRAICTFMV